MVWVQNVPYWPSPIPYEPKVDDFPLTLKDVLHVVNAAPALTSLILTDVCCLCIMPIPLSNWCLQAPQFPTQYLTNGFVNGDAITMVSPSEMLTAEKVERVMQEMAGLDKPAKKTKGFKRSQHLMQSPCTICACTCLASMAWQFCLKLSPLRIHSTDTRCDDKAILNIDIVFAFLCRFYVPCHHVLSYLVFRILFN